MYIDNIDNIIYQIIAFILYIIQRYKDIYIYIYILYIYIYLYTRYEKRNSMIYIFLCEKFRKSFI